MGKRVDALVFRLLGSAAGITAFTAALLYLAGIASLFFRMRNAGLTPGDYLPLFSLDQLLRIGLTWVSPVIPVVLLLAVLLLVSVLFEHDLVRRTEAFEEERAAELDGEEAKEWRPSFREACVRTDWPKVIRHVSHALSTREERPGDAALAPKEWRNLRRRLRLFQSVWSTIVVVLLFASTGLLIAPIAAITYLLVLVTLHLVGTRPAEQNLTPLIVVVILGFLVNAIADPSPLPRAVVVTRSAPGEQRGSFIDSSDGAWYIGEGKGRVVVIPESDIVCSSLQSRPRADPLWRILVGRPQTEPKPARPPCGDRQRRS